MAAHQPRLTMTGPLLRGSGELHIVGRQDVVTIADPRGAMQRLLGLTDGSRTREQIVLALVSEFPGMREREVTDALDELESAGLLEDRLPAGTILRDHAARHGWRGRGVAA